MTDPFAGTCYKKNFLKEVIARVDFLNPLPEIDASIPASLRDAAIRSFPIPEPREMVQREIKFSPQGVASKEESFKEWRFHDKERTKTLSIGRQAVFVQQRGYQSYEILRTEFIGILDQIANTFPDIILSRLGLRYVNTIEITEPHPTDWTAYISPQLLSVFDFPPESDRPAISRVFHNLELAFDSFNLRYRFGMHNPDYPARLRQKVFVLDLDAYSQSIVEIRSIDRFFDDFHATTQRYFEHSITDNLRRVMNGS